MPFFNIKFCITVNPFDTIQYNAIDVGNPNDTNDINTIIKVLIIFICFACSSLEDIFIFLNENIVAKIIGIDTEKKNLKLSIKNINYKTDGSSILPLENGFEVLSQRLPEWIDEALKKIDK